MVISRRSFCAYGRSRELFVLFIEHLIRPSVSTGAPFPQGEGFAALFTRAKKKRQKDSSSFCLRPYLRDSLRPEKASGCPFGVRASPHFPKCRPDPILLPESFCIPLRRRGQRGLSRYPSTDPDSVLSPGNRHFPCKLTKKTRNTLLEFRT